MHETHSLGRAHLTMVVVEASEDDDWSSGGGSSLREKKETGKGRKSKKGVKEVEEGFREKLESLRKKEKREL